MWYNKVLLRKNPMQSKTTNPCTRCGKERKSGKSYTEEIKTFLGSTTITHTDTVCPDAECQKIVEEKLAVQKAKTEELKLEKQKKLDIATAARKQKALDNLKV